MPKEWSYFTEFTYSKGVFYLVVVSYLILSCLVVLVELFINHGCDESYNIKYENPSYHDTPCRHTRYPYLLFLTPDECGYGRRLVVATLLGSVIGWERRQADRPAGMEMEG